MSNEKTLQPTEEMMDSVRGILLFHEGPRTYGSMRDYCNRGTWGLKHWPQWALDMPNPEHINKMALAALIFEIMATAGQLGALLEDAANQLESAGWLLTGLRIHPDNKPLPSSCVSQGNDCTALSKKLYALTNEKNNG